MGKGREWNDISEYATPPPAPLPPSPPPFPFLGVIFQEGYLEVLVVAVEEEDWR